MTPCRIFLEINDNLSILAWAYFQSVLDQILLFHARIVTCFAPVSDKAVQFLPLLF